MNIAKKVGEAITRASAYTPWESACLAQSLTAQKMLQKRGIPGVFYLGAAKDEESEAKMKAHAWSQCGDTIITGGGGHEDVYCAFCVWMGVKNDSYIIIILNYPRIRKW